MLKFNAHNGIIYKFSEFDTYAIWQMESKVTSLYIKSLNETY